MIWSVGAIAVRCSLTPVSLSSWSATLGAPFGKGTLSCPVAPFHIRILMVEPLLAVVRELLQAEHGPCPRRCWVRTGTAEHRGTRSGRRSCPSPGCSSRDARSVTRASRPSPPPASPPNAMPAPAAPATLSSFRAAYALALGLVLTRVLNAARLVVLHSHPPSLSLERRLFGRETDLADPIPPSTRPQRWKLRIARRPHPRPPAPAAAARPGGQRLDDRLVVVDAAAPETAADGLESRPERGVRRAGRRPASTAGFVGRSLEHARGLLGGPLLLAVADEVEGRLERCRGRRRSGRGRRREACRSARPRAPPGRRGRCTAPVETPEKRASVTSAILAARTAGSLQRGGDLVGLLHPGAERPAAGEHDHVARDDRLAGECP